MRAWASLLRHQRHSRYIGIIVTRRDGDIELNPWLVAVDVYGTRFTVTPAYIESR